MIIPFVGPRNPRQTQFARGKKIARRFLLFSFVSVIPFTAGIANADLSDDWKRSQEGQRERVEHMCQDKWKNANYVHPAEDSGSWRWLVTATSATRIITSDRCYLDAARRIGREESMKCIDESLFILGVVTQKELLTMTKIRYFCVALLKLERLELVEYRKSKRFGLERRVVGVLLPGALTPLQPPANLQYQHQVSSRSFPLNLKVMRTISSHRFVPGG